MKNKTPLLPAVNDYAMVSYVYSSIRSQVQSIYIERLFLCFIKEAQKEIEGLRVMENIDIIKKKARTEGKELIIPVNKLLKANSNDNKKYAVSSLMSLMDVKVSYYEGNDWHASQIVNDADYFGDIGVIRVTLHANLWNALLDFSRGCRRVDLTVARRLSNWYALRLYILVVAGKGTVTYTISYLRELFGTQNKYPVNSDFIRKIIAPAKVELDKYSPDTFDYKVNFQKREKDGKALRGSPEMASITFIPQKNNSFVGELKSLFTIKHNEFDKSTNDSILYNLLKDSYGFDDKGLRANENLFREAQKHFDLMLFLTKDKTFLERANNTENPSGYVINSIKNHLKEKFNVDYQTSPTPLSSELLNTETCFKDQTQQNKKPTRKAVETKDLTDPSRYTDTDLEEI